MPTHSIFSAFPFNPLLPRSTVDELFRSPAQEDLTMISGELHFGDGEHEKTIVTAAVDDSVEEKDEVFSVQLLCAAGGNPGKLSVAASLTL